MATTSNAAASGITPGAVAGEYERQRRVVAQLLTRLRTTYLAKVVAVSNAGTVAGIGTVDVQPIVGQLDNAGNVIAHGTIHAIPYLRIQGGANAVILDPQVGDIGLVAVCDRDSSAARSNRDASAPGSLRKFDMSDSVYTFSLLSDPPSQYVAFSSDGIDLVSPVRIRMSAPTIVLQAANEIGLTAGSQVTNSAPAIALDGALTQGDGAHGGDAHIAGTLTADRDVVAAGTSLHEHEHRDSQGGKTSAPL